MMISRPLLQPRSSLARSLRVSAAKAKLYTNPGSRGKIPEWAISELGIESDVDLVVLDMRAGDHKQASYLAVHPFGQVPALADDAINVFESGAILMYLFDKANKLPTPQVRAKANAWVLFANSTLAPALFGSQAAQKDRLLGTLNDLLANKQYLEGDFGVPDIAVGSYLLYLPIFYPDNADLMRMPHLVSYMKRLVERKGCPSSYREAFDRWVSNNKSSGGGGLLDKIFSKK